MAEEQEEAARRQAMQRAIMGAVNELDRSHLSQSVNPMLGRATPGLANNPRNAPNIAAARILSGNPDTMGMALPLAMQRNEADKPLVLKPGEAAYGSRGERLFDNPAEVKKPEQSEFEKFFTNISQAKKAIANYPPGTVTHDAALAYLESKQSNKSDNRNVQLYNPETNEYFWATPDEANSMARNGFVPASERSRGGPKQYTEGQYQAAGFADRMASAEGLLEQAQASGANPSGLYDGWSLSNTTMNPSLQKYRQAQKDWVRAKLRKESGATIGDEEMATEIETYFPQIGDKPDTIKQKAEARRRATESMIFSSGGAYSDLVRQPARNSGAKSEQRNYVGWGENGKRLYRGEDGQLYEED
jgi:hypothetical protein